LVKPGYSTAAPRPKESIWGGPLPSPRYSHQMAREGRDVAGIGRQLCAAPHAQLKNDLTVGGFVVGDSVE